MKKHFFPAFVLLAIFLALALSGCVQVGGKNFSDLKAIYERYGLDGVIAPGNSAELKSYSDDLYSLKAIAQQQRIRQSEALVALVDYRLNLSGMQKAFLNSVEEARFIDYYDTSCNSRTSLRITIDFVDDAITKADLSIALASNFAKNYPEFLQEAGFDLEKENEILNDFKSVLLEKKNAYNAFCT